MQKKAYIKTYGCQMNVYDSEKMMNILKNMNYEIIDDYKNSDLVILNTCHIREKATEKVYSELGRINIEKKHLETQGKNMIIVMSGCVAQAEGETVFKRAKFVDIVVGPESYHTLPKLIEAHHNGQKNLINIEFIADEKFDSLPEEHAKNTQASAFVTIQEGCDKFCAFCVVPYTRGAEFSRNIEGIINEIQKKADEGTKEIVLLGQNVNAFCGKDAKGKLWKLSDLIAKIADISNIERIRYTTSHPCDMSEDLIMMHGYEKKLMPLLNLPVQSGSNEILKKMNRRHTREEYIEIMQKLQQNRPEIIFSSDFIVGFPGETEQNFEDTLDLVKKVQFKAQSFSFKYSPRPGTTAAEKEQISEEIKSKRLAVLQNILEFQQHEFNKSMLGRTISVLFDDSQKTRLKTQIAGRSEFMQIVICRKKANFSNTNGKISQVKITDIHTNSLVGEVVG